MRAPLTLLVAFLALAGCLQAAPSTDVEPAADADGADAPAQAVDPGWPDLAAAKVRPGVQILPGEVAPGVEVHDCTSNFVFASPDNVSLYLGTAAHCIDDLELGAAVSLAHGAATGTLAYSSWATMDEVGEKDETALAFNDFALIRIDDESRGVVHPAVLHFGGPVALADSAAVAVGDKVLSFGNSALRMEVEPTSWKEGVVHEKRNAWSNRVYFATPGIPGDSGSGAMTGDGRALGVVVTLAITGAPASNGVTNLDLALAYARDHAGLDVRLATWDLLDGGILPVGGRL